MCEKERKTGCNSDPLHNFLLACFAPFHLFVSSLSYFPSFLHSFSFLIVPSFPYHCLHSSHIHRATAFSLAFVVRCSLLFLPHQSYPIPLLAFSCFHHIGGAGANSNWVDLPPLFCHFCEACCLILRCNPCPLFDSYHVGILSCLLLIKRDCKTNLEVDLNLYALPIPQVSYGT